uniref:Uncharacterized protein n=1 Tax=Octopus bimaculoides TaxID=37653 RepID=A0A0L8HLG2_OCTBM
MQFACVSILCGNLYLLVCAYLLTTAVHVYASQTVYIFIRPLVYEYISSQL